PERRDSARRRPRRQLAGEPCLADAGLADHQKERSPGGEGAVERIAQLAQLPLAADEPPGGRRRHDRSFLPQSKGRTTRATNPSPSLSLIPSPNPTPIPIPTRSTLDHQIGSFGFGVGIGVGLGLRLGLSLAAPCSQARPMRLESVRMEK